MIAMGCLSEVKSENDITITNFYLIIVKVCKDG
jgi:hypothetical protein